MRQPNRHVRDGTLLEIYFERWASLLDIPIEDEQGKTWRLFPELWAHQARDWVSHKQSTLCSAHSRGRLLAHGIKHTSTLWSGSLV